MPFEKEIDLARAVAAKAGEAALRHFGGQVPSETKSDDSPVTAADRESEALIARMLADAFPDDGLLGEEGALRDSPSGRRWIIDPIDGTRDFMRGIPTWAVLLGLEAQGDVVAGVAHLPALKETFWAARGEGAFRNDTRIRVSSISLSARSVFCIDCLNRIPDSPFSRRLIPWLSHFWAVRSLGGIMDAMLVASGRAEAWIEPVAKAWDLAPIKVIIEEAGGRFFNFDGGASIHGGNCAVCVPPLEAEIRRLLATSP